jgi:hypothetical protein
MIGYLHSLFALPYGISTIHNAAAGSSTQKKVDPSSLKGMLIINNNTRTHELYLYSYSTGKGNHLTGHDYPLKPTMSLQTGSYVRLTAGNPGLELVPTEIILSHSDGNGELFNLSPTPGISLWYMNVAPGIYRLQVNAVYGRSSDETAKFIGTIQVLGRSKADVIEKPAESTQASSMSQSNKQISEKQVPTLMTTKSSGSSFKITVKVGGEDINRTNKIIFLTTDPSFGPVKFIQGKSVDMADSFTSFELPRNIIKTGEKFMACLISLDPLHIGINNESISCKMGVNSPASKPEAIVFGQIN